MSFPHNESTIKVALILLSSLPSFPSVWSVTVRCLVKNFDVPHPHFHPRRLFSGNIFQSLFASKVLKCFEVAGRAVSSTRQSCGWNILCVSQSFPCKTPIPQSPSLYPDDEDYLLHLSRKGDTKVSIKVRTTWRRLFLYSHLSNISFQLEMALLNNTIVNTTQTILTGGYEYYLWTLTLSDPRSKGFLFVDSPTPTIAFTVLYLFLVYVGPIFMQKWVQCANCDERLDVNLFYFLQ